MNWKTFQLSDFEQLQQIIRETDFMGSDTSLANLYFLQKKYDLKMTVEAGFLFRYYTYSDENGVTAKNRTGYGFPFKVDDKAELKTALKLIFEDAEKNGRTANFILISERQKKLLEQCLEDDFPKAKVEWVSERNDSDYLYSRNALSELKGKTYHKKKNHVSRFLKTYEGRWEFRSLNLCDITEDIKKVSMEWLTERGEQDVKVLAMEHESIEMAVDARKIFKMTGGVLYVDGKPVAMTLASPINSKILDVHYEKCLTAAAQEGGYAVINWCFANSAKGIEYLNREEDMGVEGLRKAKLSYHPDIILDKYYGEIRFSFEVKRC